MAKKPERSNTTTMAALNASALAPALAVFRHDARVTPASGRHGGASLRVDGVLFALAVRGALAVKLSLDDARALVDAQRGTPLVMGARTMKQWVVLALDAGGGVDADILRAARDHALADADADA